MTTQTLEPPVQGELVWEPTRPLGLTYSHLTEALRELRARRGDVDTYWSYHDGDHDQVWLNDSLRKAFGGTGMSDLQDNYCGMAVQAFLSRLSVDGWQLRKPLPRRSVAEVASEPVPPADPMVLAAAESWDANDMQLEQDDVYRGAFVAGGAYVQVWPKYGPTGEQATTEDGEPAWDVTTKDARNVYVKRGAKLRTRLWAATVWLEGNRWRATILYSDQDGQPAEVVRLATVPVQTQTSSSRGFPERANRFLLDTDDPGGPMPEVFGGACPVVPFTLDRRGRSWLRDVVPLQDKINKLAANKMVAAEFLAFPQRYVLSDQDIPDGVLRYSPAKVLQLDPGGGIGDDGVQAAATQVGEFTTADLKVYDDAQAAEVDKLFTIKLLPRHLRVNSGSDVSGDAIRADEGPHVSYVRSCQRLLGAAWSDVQQLMGHDVVPVWVDPEVANAESEARELQALVLAGVPLLTALRKVGWTDQEIADAGGELAAMRAVQDRAAQTAALASSQGRGVTDMPAGEDDALALDKRVTMAKQLIDSGYDPTSVRAALDLPVELVHSSLVPSTLQVDPSGEPAPVDQQTDLGAAAPPVPPVPPVTIPPQEA